MALADRQPEEVPEPQSAPQSASERSYGQAIDLHRDGNLEAAACAYARVLELDAHHQEALNNLGTVLQAQGKLPAALAAFERALDLRPEDPELHHKKGEVLRLLGRLEAALASLHRAAAFAPDNPDAHHALAMVLRDLGQFGEAVASFDRARELSPNDPRLRSERAQALLAAGELRDGFRALQDACEAEAANREDAALPLWRGERLGSRTLRLGAAPNLAETVQFCRFAGQIKKGGGRVVLECQPALIPLVLELDGIDAVVPPESREPAGLFLPLLALPGVLRTTDRSLPAQVPYLTAPGTAGFDLTHPQATRLSLGIVWSGASAAPSSGPIQEPGLEPFFALLRWPGVAAYSLQRGDATAALKELGAAGLVHDLGHLLDGLDDWARIVCQLDLIVTTDAVTAHLAGALGRPVWLIVPAVADWCWSPETAATPWYPTMRLFRQTRYGDWSGPFEAAARKLGALVAA